MVKRKQTEAASVSDTTKRPRVRQAVKTTRSAATKKMYVYEELTMDVG